MAKEFSRPRRIGEQMQRELALLIQQELKDPRLGMVTVSAVEVTRDLAHAKVYITVFDPQHDVEQSLAILRKAAGFLRHELGRRVVMRSLPELHFVYDTSVEQGAKLSALIDEAVARDKKDKSD